MSREPDEGLEAADAILAAIAEIEVLAARVRELVEQPEQPDA